MKACSDCKHEKPAKEFYRRSSGGRQPICKDCGKARSRVTNQALAMLRERHRDEYMAIRAELTEAYHAELEAS